MPLTYVIEHLNSELKRLHKDSRLQATSELLYTSGEVLGRIDDFTLHPLQIPVFDVRKARVAASDTALLIYNSQGATVNPKSLYLNAWDAPDVIFLDRFLRTLHALNHINLQREKIGQLILDVHARHISSVPDQHGQVFEQLLSQLGLTPSNITLRLNLAKPATDIHAQNAAHSFIDRGYNLLAVVDDLTEEPLHYLQDLGIAWVSADEVIHQHPAHLKLWKLKAQLLGITTVVTKVVSMAALETVLDAGLDLIGGRKLSPEIPTHAVDMSTIGQLLQTGRLSKAEAGLGL